MTDRTFQALAASCEHSRQLEKRLARTVSALEELVAESENGFHNPRAEGFSMARDAIAYARAPYGDA